MRVLLYFSCTTILLVHLSLCAIRLPGQNITKNTLTTMGIKTLGWQGEDDILSSPQIHHNYSKVSVRNQGISSFSQSQIISSQSQSSSFHGGVNQGQQSVEEDDYLDLTSQNHGIGGNDFSQTQQTDSFANQGQQEDDLQLEQFSQFLDNDDQLLQGSNADQTQQQNSYLSHATFKGQEEDDGQTNLDQNQQLSSSFGGQEVDDYDMISSYDNNKIYTSHNDGNRLEFDQVMEAENLQQQQQFEDFPDYDIGQLQLVDQTDEASNIEPEERQAKHFYPVNKPIYIHGFKYPPDPENINPSNAQKPQTTPSEIYTKCPKMVTGQFVYSASCNQFLNCWKGRGFVQNCAPGTLFNPKTLECDFASKVQCLTGPRKPEQNHIVTGQKIEISCPAEYSGVVPHYSDCSKFINCANGVENVMDCPPGTLFSVKINNCDFPYKTECASWSVQFGNSSVNDGGSNGNYQGQDNDGQNNYYQNGNNKYDHKYSSSDGFRFHQGSGTQGSQITSYDGHSQSSLYGYNQGPSSRNKGIYDQSSQTSTSVGGSGYDRTHQTNQGSYGSHGNLNPNLQTSYGPDQQYMYSQHQRPFTGDQSTNGHFQGENYYGQNKNQGLYNKNYHDQNQQNVGSQGYYVHGSQILHTGHQNQNLAGSQNQFYGQNQETLGSQGQYAHTGQIHGSQSIHGQNQETVGSQSHYVQTGQIQGSQRVHGQNQENQGQYTQTGQIHGSQGIHGQNQETLGSQGQYAQAGQIYGSQSIHGQNQETVGSQGHYVQTGQIQGSQRVHGQNQENQGHYTQTGQIHGSQSIYGQNQETVGSQDHYAQTGQIQGSKSVHGQNQETLGSPSHYAHAGQIYGSQSTHGQNQETLENQSHYAQAGQISHGKNQGQYNYGQGQSQHFYHEGIDTNQNVDVDSLSATKYSGSGKVKCLDGATGLFPHPSDCSKFLNCASGQTFVQDCGPGTVFNPNSKVCDFPYNVKCNEPENYQHLINVRTQPKPTLNQQQGSSSHGYYTSQGNSGKNSGSSGQWQSVDGSENSFKGSVNTKKVGETVKCPQDASGLYPHPTICSKFLNCGSGQTFIQDCGPGTVFNPISKVCDFPYNVECGGNYGEGLIDVKQVPVVNEEEDSHSHGWYDQSQNHFLGSTSGGNTPQKFNGENTNVNQQNINSGQASNWNKNWQQGIYDQNPNTVVASSTTNQQKIYGTDTHHQGSSSSTAEQDFYIQNTGGQQHGQKHNTVTGTSSTNQDGFYGQNAITDTKNQGQDSYGQNTGINSQQHGVYDQKHNILTGSSNTNQQEFYGQNSITENSNQGQKHIGSSSSQQGSYGKNQSGSKQQGTYGTGSTTINKNKIADDDQDIQESKYYNQGQNINTQNWHSQSGNRLKPHHSPPPFPSTDINADYEFGNEDATLEVGAINSKPKTPNLHSKRKNFCEPLDFHCSVDDCIPQSMVCDGVKDCPNGADEQNCEKYLKEFTITPNTILAVREKERYLNISLIYCAKTCLELKGFQCKSFSYRKEDGACFLSDTNVGNSGALIISHPYSYYEVKTFTVNCTNLYKCPNKKCITFKQVCDGINDCGDRSDEKGCSAQAFGYKIQLKGTDKKHEGRIEIKAFGKWGYICDDKFGLRDADVACRELGFPLGSLEVKANSYYAQDLNDKDVFYMMDDVTCLGNETSLRDCDFNGWGVNNCEPQEVVGIVCKTPLENCPKDYWKCESSQDCIPVNFVCDEVFDCEDQSDESDKYCEAPIELRLVNGKSKYEGRVEIRYHGVWGTVCDDDFNDDSAKVVCKHLGYPGQAVVKKDGFFGAGSDPIWLDQVFCQGNETGLEHCVHWNWGEHNCEHSEDVGVSCSNSYENIGQERNVKLDIPSRMNEVLPEYLFPDRCGLRKDDQFLEDDAVHFRVVKGSVAKNGEHPWQASLRIKNKVKSTHWCGAVVISQKFILTAAHCLAGFAKGAYFVVAGDYNTDDNEGTEQEAFIEEFYIHEKFRDGHKMNNDVAIIKLKGKGLIFTKDVQPICLPEADLEYQTGLNCTISGFGSIESGTSGYSHQLRAGWVPLQSREVCQMPHVYGSTLTEGMICAGSLDEGVDACDGDSGGPLACLHDGLFTLYGLTSWGHHCGYANKPGVYAKVSHYRNWIDETIRKHSS